MGSLPECLKRQQSHVCRRENASLWEGQMVPGAGPKTAMGKTERAMNAKLAMRRCT